MSAALILLAALVAPAGTGRLCEAALADAQRFAAAQGWTAEARCRGPLGRPLPTGAVLQAEPWPAVQALSSGALTWPVRVRVGDAAPYVQRVPLTVGWIAPAWTSTRELAMGSTLQAGDLELRPLRWPDGMPLQRVDATAPPDGRVRHSLRRGEVVTDAVLLTRQDLLRGDRVTALLAEGPVEVRLTAELLAPARVGERARVQAAGRRTALQGRLVDAQTLKVDSE